MYDTITTSYYGNLDKNNMIDNAVNSMLSEVGDEYTNYSSKSDASSFLETVDGVYEGIVCMVSMDENNNIVYGENWRSNENTIMEKINKDIEGKKFVYDKLTYDKYEGNGLLNLLNGKKIIEVTNEIDNSKYLENLLQQYQMPTVEIIYIVYN